MCPACGGTETDPLFAAGEHRYVACSTCGSGRLAPIPSLDPAELYGADYFTGGTVPGGYADYGIDEALHRRNATDRLARIARAGFRSPGRVIEVGSGYGFFLAEARKQGWEIAGSDVSAHARSRAARLDIELVANTADLTGPADVLAAFQVLEHLADPFAVVMHGVELLRSGGLLIVESWNRNHRMARALGRRWQQVSPPSVIHLFTSDGMGRLAKRAGLADVAIRPTSKYVSLGAVAGQLTSGRSRWRGPIDRARASRLGVRPIKYGFGDLVTLTARKP